MKRLWFHGGASMKVVEGGSMEATVVYGGADAFSGSKVWQQGHPALPANPAFLGSLVWGPPQPS